MINTGNSQNFFRTRINRQSSATKSISCPLDHDPIRLKAIMISSLLSEYDPETWFAPFRIML